MRLLSLRTTILATTIGILICTVAAVVWVTQRRWTESTDLLFKEVLTKASLEIRQHVRSLLEVGESEGEQLGAYVLRQPTGIADRKAVLDDLAPLLVDLVRSHRDLTYASVGFEDTGDYVHAHRASGGALEIQTSRAEDGRFVRQDRIVGKGSQPPVVWDYDPRERPYYTLAKRLRESAWTETYKFLDLVGGKPKEESMGVTYAIPIQSPSGKLVGVASIDISLKSLDSFLRRVRVSKTGFAVLIESIPGKEPRLLAGDRGRIRNSEVLAAVDGLQPDSTANEVELEIAAAKNMGLLTRVRQDGPPWIVGSFIPERELIGPIESIVRQTMVLIAAGLVIAMVASIFIATFVSRPIRNIVARADRIRALKMRSEGVEPSRIQEVRQLDDAFRRLESTMTSFTQFVPTDVVRALLASGKKAEPQGELRNVTVMFADVEGFTAIAASEDADRAVKLLSHFFEIITEAVETNGGMVDKFIGDEVMAVWGALSDDPSHAASACRAALQAMSRILVEGKLRVRIGIHTGEAVVGIIGTPARLNFTSIGDAVNVAKRIEAANKNLETRILISQETLELLGDGFSTRDLGNVSVPGMPRPLHVYELVAER
ncbi:MAG: hypothetical protein HONBIEJF_02170 [Fimbriimonadaceae bacterium]|nr:hypothetical protein [Fimbriimonadaceae bacterium]